MLDHILLALYGLYLCLKGNVILMIVGFSILYRHFMKICGCIELFKIGILSPIGALVGLVVGIHMNDPTIYMPMTYSFLSKFYIKQPDISILVIFFSLLLFFFLRLKNKKRKEIKEIKERKEKKVKQISRQKRTTR